MILFARINDRARRRREDQVVDLPRHAIVRRSKQSVDDLVRQGEQRLSHEPDGNDSCRAWPQNGRFGSRPDLGRVFWVQLKQAGRRRSTQRTAARPISSIVATSTIDGSASSNGGGSSGTTLNSTAAKRAPRTFPSASLRHTTMALTFISGTTTFLHNSYTANRILTSVVSAAHACPIMCAAIARMDGRI